MTAVEWLVKELKSNSIDLTKWHNDLLEKAKEMEKQQIMDAYDKGQENPFEYSEDNEVNYYDGNNYYNETFKMK